MNAIVHSSEPMPLRHRDGKVWATKHVCQDGSSFTTYQHDDYKGMCGQFNQNPDRGILGGLDSHCISCHEHGYCKSMCPVVVPGFFCPADGGPT